MKITNELTDETILAEIGARIARRRLDFQLTQAGLASAAGVAKRTLERVEAGATAQMSTVIRIFRALDLLPSLDRALPESKPGPIELMKRKGKSRQRASAQSSGAGKHAPWTWGDEP